MTLKTDWTELSIWAYPCVRFIHLILTPGRLIWFHLLDRIEKSYREAERHQFGQLFRHEITAAYLNLDALAMETRVKGKRLITQKKIVFRRTLPLLTWRWWVLSTTLADSLFAEVNSHAGFFIRYCFCAVSSTKRKLFPNAGQKSNKEHDSAKQQTFAFMCPVEAY